MKRYLLKIRMSELTFVLMSCLFVSCNHHTLETKVHVSTEVVDGQVGNLKIYMDASVSMRGFVDFIKLPDASSDFNRDVPIILSDFRRNLINNSIERENYFLVTEWNDKTIPEPVSWKKFKDKIINKDTYTGQDTQIYTILKKCVEDVSGNDIAIFITDCVLSEGPAKIHSLKSDNTKFFGNLQREIKEAFDQVYDKGLSVAIVRTKGNYNGYYYCSCKEAPVPEFRDSVMANRPLYYIMLGKGSILSKVVNSFDVKSTDYEICYFPREQQPLFYSLLESDKCAGLNGITYGNEGSEYADSTYLEVHVNLDDFIDEEPIRLYLCLPGILENSSLYKLSEDLGIVNDTYFITEVVSKSQCQENVKMDDNEFWSRYNYFYALNFKKASEIKATEMKPECELSLLLPNMWKNNQYSVGNDSEKDYDLPLKKMEGRTFGLMQFLQAIDYSSFGNNTIKDDKAPLSQYKVGGINLKIIIDK